MTGATYITAISKNTSAETFMRGASREQHTAPVMWHTERRGTYMHSKTLYQPHTWWLCAYIYKISSSGDCEHALSGCKEPANPELFIKRQSVKYACRTHWPRSPALTYDPHSKALRKGGRRAVCKNEGAQSHKSACKSRSKVCWSLTWWCLAHRPSWTK